MTRRKTAAANEQDPGMPFCDRCQIQHFNTAVAEQIHADLDALEATTQPE